MRRDVSDYEGLGRDMGAKLSSRPTPFSSVAPTLWRSCSTPPRERPAASVKFKFAIRIMLLTISLPSSRPPMIF